MSESSKIRISDYATVANLTPPSSQNPREYPHKLNSPESRVIGLHSRRWQYESIFIQIFVVGSERCMFFETECVMALQGHPRSLILAPIEGAYATSYWSSIVTLPSCHVSEILQVTVLCSEQSPTPVPPELWGCSLWTRLPILWLRGSEDPKLIIRVITFELFQHRPMPTVLQRHRQTDGRPDDLR